MDLFEAIATCDPNESGVRKTDWFHEAFIRHYAPMGGLTAGECEALCEGYRGLPDTLRCALYRAIAILYVDQRGCGELFTGDPGLEEQFGWRDAGTFYALLVIGGYRLGEEKWRKQGLSVEMMREALSDLRRWTALYCENYGSVGVPWHVVCWSQGFLRAERLALGRLQFDLNHEFAAPVKVFVPRARAGEPVVLAESDVPVAPDGTCAELPESKLTILTESSDAWRGTPVDLDSARFRHDECVLAKSEWRLVVERGTPMINVHIPAGGGMSPECCADSFRQLTAFMSIHFPGRKWGGFCCYSWLLDPQLRQLLPEESNILQFQYSGLTFPLAGKADTEFRVCGAKGFGKIVNPNRMQRALAAFAADGGIFRSGGWVKLKR